ncbi:MAG TPA: hypothetical protein P5027_08065 [Flavobacteriales bacterium]|nr:hypothetical protein [Flavobacteriales bacterium]
MRNVLNTLLIAVALPLVAQEERPATTDLPPPTEVRHASMSFSTGIHPTFAVTFEGTEERDVERYWKDNLKDISADVSTKKELLATGALLPNISSDTVRVLMKADRPSKKSPHLMVHVAFLTVNGWVGPDSDPSEVEACRQYVYDRSVAFKREVMNAQWQEAEKVLNNLQREYDLLVREHGRMEQQHKKSRDREEEARTDQGRLEDEVKRGREELDAALKAAQDNPGEEATERADKAGKELGKAEKQLEKARDTEVDQRKKAEQLEWDLKQNEEAQKSKQVEIAQQQEAVEALHRKLMNVR